MDETSKTAEAPENEVQVLRTRIEEIEELKARNRILEKEVEILKKTCATIISLDPPGSSPLSDSGAVLVVEDNELFRNFAVMVLAKNGFHTLEAENAGEAIEICREQGENIQLLLTDIVMPEVGGGKLVELLEPLGLDMKVLYMSGYAKDALAHQDVYDIIDSGASFIQKPFSSGELMEKITAELQRS